MNQIKEKYLKNPFIKAIYHSSIVTFILFILLGLAVGVDIYFNGANLSSFPFMLTVGSIVFIGGTLFISLYFINIMSSKNKILHLSILFLIIMSSMFTSVMFPYFLNK